MNGFSSALAISGSLLIGRCGAAVGEQQDQGVRGPGPIGWGQRPDPVADPEQHQGDVAALGQRGGGTIKNGRGWHWQCLLRLWGPAVVLVLSFRGRVPSVDGAAGAAEETPRPLARLLRGGQPPTSPAPPDHGRPSGSGR